MWPFTRSKARSPGELEDCVWLSSQARDRALAAEVDQVLATGSHIMVTGHHTSTLRAACAMLTDAPRALELVETPTAPLAFASLLDQCPSPTCIVIGAEFLEDGPAPGIRLNAELKVIVLGRHALRHYDDAIIAFVHRVLAGAEVVFSLAFDDPMMLVFSADRQKALLGRLGMTEGESISHPLLTRSIRSAQDKIAQRIARHGEARIEGFPTLTREHLPPTLRR